MTRISVDVREKDAANLASFGKSGQPKVILESVLFLLEVPWGPGFSVNTCSCARRGGLRLLPLSDGHVCARIRHLEEIKMKLLGSHIGQLCDSA